MGTPPVESLLTVEGFLLAFKDREWMDKAICKGMGTTYFFPPRGVQASHTNKIRALCDSCPVQQECRDYGEYETHGFWGGVPVKDRQQERVRRSQHDEDADSRSEVDGCSC